MGGCWAHRANDHRHLPPAQGTTRFEGSDLRDALTSLHHGQEEEQAGERINCAGARCAQETHDGYQAGPCEEHSFIAHKSGTAAQQRIQGQEVVRCFPGTGRTHAAHPTTVAE